jgi:hypothetical protein
MLINGCSLQDGVIGHWIVRFKETKCIPYWGQFQDKVCLHGRDLFQQYM